MAVQQLDLITPSRWPKKPYCSDDLSKGICIRSLNSALKRPYIQANPPHLRIWSIFDVDRAGAVLAWEDADLPPPSWTAMNMENAHAHLVWGLSVPVLVDSPDMRQKPLRYLCAVEAAFRDKLEADPGYSGLLTKNPLHERWRVLRRPQLVYELSELAAWVDLPKHAPKRKPEEVGLGRNVTLFDWLAKWSYKAIRRLETRNFTQWQADCNEKALEHNGDFPTPLDSREVWHIAKSVSKWTWRNMTLEGWQQFVVKTHTPEIQATRGRRNRPEIQADKGKKGGIKSGALRLAASGENRASARLMRIKGMTQAEIAAELGVNQSTIARWLAE